MKLTSIPARMKLVPVISAAVVLALAFAGVALAGKHKSPHSKRAHSASSGLFVRSAHGFYVEVPRGREKAPWREIIAVFRSDKLLDTSLNGKSPAFVASKHMVRNQRLAGSLKGIQFEPIDWIGNKQKRCYVAGAPEVHPLHPRRDASHWRLGHLRDRTTVGRVVSMRLHKLGYRGNFYPETPLRARRGNRDGNRIAKRFESIPKVKHALKQMGCY